MIRVTGPDPAFTRTVKSWSWATERARRVALLTGSSEIQRRESRGEWQTVERYAKTGSRVSRVEVGR
jgi:hypothetical protein